MTVLPVTFLLPEEECELLRETLLEELPDFPRREEPFERAEEEEEGRMIAGGASVEPG